MRSGFTLIEVMVTLGVLAAVMVVTNQVVVSALRQVELSRNSFYVDVVLSEAFEHMNYVHEANLLRYGEADFEECKLTRLDQSLGVTCEGLAKYDQGKYLLVIEESGGQQLWNLVPTGLELVDDVSNPTSFTDDFEVFEVYEKELSTGGVVYTNIASDVRGDSSFTPLGYYRYIDVAANGGFQIVVAYLDEFSRLEVESPDYVINLDE